LEINKTVIVASRWFLYYLTFSGLFSLSYALKQFPSTRIFQIYPLLFYKYRWP